MRARERNPDMSGTRNKKRRRTNSKKALPPLAVVLILLALIWLAEWLLNEQSEPVSDPAPAVTQTVSGQEELTVYYVDVGQGDCELLESDGEYLLIDAGGDGDHNGAVVDFLDQLGVEKLDYVIATHPHADHIQEMDDVINAYDVGTFYLPDVTTTTATFERMLDALDSRSVNVVSPQPGDTFTLGSCTAQVLGPVEIDEGDLNANSIVLRVTCGDTSFLFTGDCTAEEEEDILGWLGSNSAALQADVLKVGHHGSSTSTSAEFLEAVSPIYAVISCGVDNSYGHPHREIMEALAEIRAEIYRTDTMGTITARSDGQTITFTTEQGG